MPQIPDLKTFWMPPVPDFNFFLMPPVPDFIFSGCHRLQILYILPHSFHDLLDLKTLLESTDIKETWSDFKSKKMCTFGCWLCRSALSVSLLSLSSAHMELLPIKHGRVQAQVFNTYTADSWPGHQMTKYIVYIYIYIYTDTVYPGSHTRPEQSH